MKYFIIGAGLTGLSAARYLAEAGYEVEVHEKDSVVGGNVREFDVQGSTVHSHGPHFFHANSEKVINFVKRFSDWLPYEHRVAARTSGGSQIALPVSRDGLQQILGDSADSVLEKLTQELGTRPETSVIHLMESLDSEISELGRRIFSMFYEGYSLKQWGFNPFDLDKSVLSRVPVRLNRDSRYFTDTFQAIPKWGYNPFVEAIADHPNIDIKFHSSPKLQDFSTSDEVISTAPIDELLDFCLGPLPYRSLRFEYTKASSHAEKFDFVQTNFSDSRAFTRVVNYQLFYEQIGSGSSELLAFEYPQEFEVGRNHRYYPVLTESSKASYKAYQSLMQTDFPNVQVAGRLGDFRYYNMDQAIARGLQVGALVLSKAD